ncbi:unnamed protein product [Vitrella brassicaformis CCMP3155]|uniref:Uncharacterized protein n=1 Tax=Vitrella brassicaformis (strain CCMP3155) TaxID=1169540 RepID=A0A0G4EUK2_VITBC|nr:unnamed protein product [Vitrella brassicaformis CCMP3155]|eukprot:CEM01985.1 unnamed protein product [Vitrella brassicaformis CCMP3155]
MMRIVRPSTLLGRRCGQQHPATCRPPARDAHRSETAKAATRVGIRGRLLWGSVLVGGTTVGLSAGKGSSSKLASEALMRSGQKPARVCRLSIAANILYSLGVFPPSPLRIDISRLTASPPTFYMSTASDHNHNRTTQCPDAQRRNSRTSHEVHRMHRFSRMFSTAPSMKETARAAARSPGIRGRLLWGSVLVGGTTVGLSGGTGSAFKLTQEALIKSGQKTAGQKLGPLQSPGVARVCGFDYNVDLSCKVSTDDRWPRWHAALVDYITSSCLRLPSDIAAFILYSMG